jgi:hypothetical protein
MADVISNIVQDKQDIKYQLGGDIPSVTPVAKLWSENIQPVEVVTKYEKKTYDGSVNVFILNSSTYGVLGTNKLGDAASITTLHAVVPKDNIYIEYFGQDTYISSGSSTGTLDTSAETYTLNSGEVLQSEVITKLQAPITQAKILTHDDLQDVGGGLALPFQLGVDTFSGNNVSLHLSNDGGTTWTAANEGEIVTFSSTSVTDELHYRVTAGPTSGTLIIDSPIYVAVNDAVN